MSPLASRYRPQTFAEVGGQELVTSALSRVCETDSPAPAYLLSGTRGVGKTTIARIFAKALNCERGPAKEPCNACPQCRKITEGRHVDVCEIDGASNNGVEDARSLREKIGYAPMEGRYKVFIIDEAHMLSTNAFNALLKTLEEPPSRVVFIFATTEAHKFPITIVSRCQHFVFGHLSEDNLVSHLDKVLKKENISCEAEALRIIARRAAGSVRDSLSLLDQVLAFANEELTVNKTREVLGLAGQELFDELFHAMAHGELQAIIKICHQVLRRGLDIGFFLRELSQSLRNLFLVSHAGEKISPVLGLSENEHIRLLKRAKDFTPAHLHGAWQMSLASQREVVLSPEPGTVLEMLLINMALLPKLMPVGQVLGLGPHKTGRVGSETLRQETVVDAPKKEIVPDEPKTISGVPDASWEKGKINWESFRVFCQARQEKGEIAPGNAVLAGLDGSFENGKILLQAMSGAAFSRAKNEFNVIRAALADFCGEMPVELMEPKESRNESEVKEELANHPELQPCMDILQAKIAHCREKK